MTTLAQPQITPTAPQAPRPNMAFGWTASILLTLPMILITSLLLFGNPEAFKQAGPQKLGATLGVWALFNGFFFAMLKTGKTQRYRWVLFSLMAFSFVLTFIPNLIETRGNVALSRADIIDGKTPFCHMVIPQISLTAALTKTITFGGSLYTGFASIGMMLVIWIGASLTLGRGWCSWVCFFGGMDEACSHLLKKPVIKNIDRRWTYLPLALLIIVMITSAATLAPTYCQWLCPFKSVTEFEEVNSVATFVQSILFVSLFLGLVIVLPILTRKRIQCSLFCPMGAFQSWTNKVNLHEIRVNQDACTNCGHCVSQCPTFSITDESVAKGHTLNSCTKCGQCVDACPKKAISYHVKGTRLFASPRLARVLFLYPAFIFLTAIGGGSMIGATLRILRLLTTGSML